MADTLEKSNPLPEAEVVPLAGHVLALKACRECPNMFGPPVSGGPVSSRVILIGQAPGDKEPVLGRPFAWTAGKTLFRWFEESTGISEQQFRSKVYMAAVCRCFPGKKDGGGDRVPDPDEIGRCQKWLRNEIEILKPGLIIAVGRLALEQFIAFELLDQAIGKQFRVRAWGHDFDLIGLPHPSGASTWHQREPGKSLLKSSLSLILDHPAFRSLHLSG